MSTLDFSGALGPLGNSVDDGLSLDFDRDEGSDDEGTEGTQQEEVYELCEIRVGHDCRDGE